ncbi:hypothetical protein CEUSTIGMA_g9717.t1 [Chlamydomonas eustigma]|uniref:SCD domain-containing protein n=1 Tax=Chlamydomonas eustigma TaxID=1157962 RepID=A0A250XGT8_9CHLO|nr:hypothetical protein CEUSTIGMA_g9717.t1 [Chlamydomonas eustigma]|eukprot:GAX82288.1 hypothetical protein CEUSTIGMA_g9717.t1 [Chlamydomonas eustigma]
MEERRSSRLSLRRHQHGIKSMKDHSESGEEDNEPASEDSGADEIKEQEENHEKGTDRRDRRSNDSGRKKARMQSAGMKIQKPPSSTTEAAQHLPPKKQQHGNLGSSRQSTSLSLVDVLGKHPGSISKTATEWLQEFRDHKLEAVAKLMSLVAKVAGYEEDITIEDVEDGDVDDLVKKMAAYVIKNMCIQPLNDKRLKAFGASYQAWWSLVVSELYSAGLLLDDLLVERLSALLISLSCSSIQQFRLAATLTASHVMSGWVTAQRLAVQDVTQTQFQLDAEQKKKPQSKNLVDGLKKQLDQQHRRANSLEATAKSLITTIFAVRFRDIIGEVRAIVIQSIAEWIKIAPEIYLSDSHLKYMGWALSDKDGSVRLQAVTGIHALFQQPNNISSLQDFKSRFEVRMKEMMWDIEENVTIAALGLLTQLVSADQVDKAAVRQDAYRLLAYPSLAIRNAASKLVACLLIDEAEQASKVLEAMEAAGPDAAAATVAAASPDAATLTGRRKPRRASGLSAPGHKNNPDGGSAPVGSPTAQGGLLTGVGDKAQQQQARVLRQQLYSLLELMIQLQKGDPVGTAEPSSGVNSASSPTAPAAPLSGGMQVNPKSPYGVNHSATSTVANLPPLDKDIVLMLIEALHMGLPVLKHVPTIRAALLDDEVLERYGGCSSVHLAQMLYEAVSRADYSTYIDTKGAAAAARKKAAKVQSGRNSRNEDCSSASVDLHSLRSSLQDASLDLMTHLPGLLAKHQAEGAVVEMLVGVIPKLNLDVFSMREEEHGFGALLQHVAEQMLRHADNDEVVNQVVNTLHHCSHMAPGDIKPVAQLALSEAVSRSAASLISAAKAVHAMDDCDLAEEVMELEMLEESKETKKAQHSASNVQGAAAGTASTAHPGGSNSAAASTVVECLYRLKSALARVSTLLLRGGESLSNNVNVYEALSYLLEDGCTASRQLGPTIMSQVLLAMQLMLMYNTIKIHGDRNQQKPPRTDKTQLDELRKHALAFMGQVNTLITHLLESSADVDAHNSRAAVGRPSTSSSAAAAGDEQGGSLLITAEERIRRQKQAQNLRLGNALLKCIVDCNILFTGDVWKGSAVEHAFTDNASDEAIRQMWTLCLHQLQHYQNTQERDDSAFTQNQNRNQGVRTGVIITLGIVSRLLCIPACLSLRHFRWLAAHLASQMVNYGPEAEESIRDTLRRCRSIRPSVMAEVYVGAMKLGYSPVIGALLEVPEAATATEPASGAPTLLSSTLFQFSSLCKKLAAMYIGHNLHREELLRMVRACINYSLEEHESRLYFLAWGLVHFTEKLPQEDCQALVAEVEDAMEGMAELYDLESEEWLPLQQYMAALKERTLNAKVNARGALKGAVRAGRRTATVRDENPAEAVPHAAVATAAAAVAPAGSRPRRISFAAPEGAAGVGDDVTRIGMEEKQQQELSSDHEALRMKQQQPHHSDAAVSGVDSAGEMNSLRHSPSSGIAGGSSNERTSEGQMPSSNNDNREGSTAVQPAALEDDDGITDNNNDEDDDVDLRHDDLMSTGRGQNLATSRPHLLLAGRASATSAAAAAAHHHREQASLLLEDDELYDEVPLLPSVYHHQAANAAASQLDGNTAGGVGSPDYESDGGDYGKCMSSVMSDVQEGSQMTAGVQEPPPRAKRNKRI